MQLYDGLPIITNKMPMAERKGIPHHLLGCIGLNEPTWVVGNFVPSALKAIEEIRSRGRLPILVGGTHYYTQALLFRESTVETASLSDGDTNAGTNLSILNEPTEVILEKLREVDPVMADRWHPKDKRKIQRSLEIWLRTGKTASQTYAEQMSGDQGASALSSDIEAERAALSGLRFPTLVFWIHAERKVLHARLDARLLKMAGQGLLDEVETLDKYLVSRRASGEEVDRTRGIWVSIGYKEFEHWAIASRSSATSESDLEKLKASGVESAQAATRQYSNRQTRWIRIKLLNALTQAGVMDNVFLLDATDISRFDERVVQPALDIAAKFLGGGTLPEPASLSTAAKENLRPKAEDLSKRPDLWLRRTCEVCGVTAVTVQQWEKHASSNRHKKATASRVKREKSQQYTNGESQCPG
jgi:tRNA dimethylallyltransferase